MTHELYKKYRPSKFKDLVGQGGTVKVLLNMIKKDEEGNTKVPHALLLTGPSGCGKTTIARILKNKLECEDRAFTEVNCADFRGIEMIRDIRIGMGRHVLAGKNRVYLIDECHQLTSDAQNAFLKILEDTPKRVYFMLGTTEPEKLKKTIRTRCTEIKVQALGDEDMEALVKGVCGKEKLTISEEVLTKLVGIAEGSARKALVLLEQISGLETEEEQAEALSKADSQRQAIEIAQAILRGAKWFEMAKILREVDEEPETIRHMILSYMTKIMLGGDVKKSARAADIIDAFRDNWYDCKKAGLLASCFIVCGR